MDGSAFSSPEAQRRTVSFPPWQEALVQAGFGADQIAAFRREIFPFLRECKQRHAGASILLARSYLEGLPAHAAASAQIALRWWLVAARKQTPAPPTTGAGLARQRNDQTGTDPSAGLAE